VPFRKLGLLRDIQRRPMAAGQRHARCERVGTLSHFALGGISRDCAQNGIDVGRALVKEKGDTYLCARVILAHVHLIRVEHDPRIAEIQVVGRSERQGAGRGDVAPALGDGLLAALGSGIAGLAADRPFMTGRWLGVEIPVVGKFGTPLLFDAGVYLVVLGAVTLIIFSLMEE